MKFWFLLLCLIPCLLHGEMVQREDIKDTTLAPLIPLEPQFPLGLTLENQFRLRDDPKKIEEAKLEIVKALSAHTFPWMLLFALLILSFLGWIAYLTKERWFKNPFEEVIPKVSKVDRVNAKLKQLQARVLSQIKLKSYYADLSSLLLDKLEERLGISTHELTTDELATKMKENVSLSSIQQNEVINIFKEIDLVKFAGVKPSIEESRLVLQKIQNLFQQIESHSK